MNEDQINLLENAARAVGVEVSRELRREWRMGSTDHWNPLIRSEDVERLISDLMMTIRITDRYVFAIIPGSGTSVHERINPDQGITSALRLAATRAAADVGFMMSLREVLATPGPEVGEDILAIAQQEIEIFERPSVMTSMKMINEMMQLRADLVECRSRLGSHE